MRRGRPRTGSILYAVAATALIITVACCVAFAHREQLIVHYYVESHLSSASPSEETRAWLLERPPLSSPILVEKLASSSETACSRAGRLLGAMLAECKDPADPQDAHLSLSLSSMIHQGYAGFSPAGRVEATNLSLDILRRHLSEWSPNVPTALATAGQTLLSALLDPSPQVQRAALGGLPEVWTWNGGDSVVSTLVATWKWRCYRRAVDLLSSPLADVRAAAAGSLVGATSHDGDHRLIALLNDVDPAVRKAALQAILRTAVDSLTSENRSRLVELLSDPDEDVRDVAQRILLASGLSAEHVQLAVLLRSEDPKDRAAVAGRVLRAAGIDAARWLHELVKDPSSLVRRSAVEAAGQLPGSDFDEVFRHLFKDDPDPDVRRACEAVLETKLARPLQ